LLPCSLVAFAVLAALTALGALSSALATNSSCSGGAPSDLRLLPTLQPADLAVFCDLVDPLIDAACSALLGGPVVRDLAVELPDTAASRDFVDPTVVHISDVGGSSSSCDSVACDSKVKLADSPFPRDLGEPLVDAACSAFFGEPVDSDLAVELDDSAASRDLVDPLIAASCIAFSELDGSGISCFSVRCDSVVGDAASDGDSNSSGVVLELSELAFCRAFFFCFFLAAFDGPVAAAFSASSAASNSSIAVLAPVAAGEPGSVIEASALLSSALMSSSLIRAVVRDIISFAFVRV